MSIRLVSKVIQIEPEDHYDFRRSPGGSTARHAILRSKQVYRRKRTNCVITTAEHVRLANSFRRNTAGEI
jgi:hypothetical protein